MQRDELLALLTPEAMTLLDDAPAVESSADALALVTKLRAAGGSPAVVAAVVTQSKLRRRAVAKFGPFAERMLFTDAGLQQATRLQVAAHHANRFRQAGAVSVADLGCGIGADAMAFASLGLEVTAYDLDEVTAAIAAHNLAPFPNAQVKHGRAEEQLRRSLVRPGQAHNKRGKHGTAFRSGRLESRPRLRLHGGTRATDRNQARPWHRSRVSP